ncbi:hypothetical protein NBRC10512v2_001822 [Rhodotorula toruloides]
MSGSSSAASPATAPAFPKVGDTFPSLLAFKLACHRAALASGIELKIKTGDANRADMRCRLGERATVNKVMDGPCCSFQIAVYKSVVEANGGDFRVNKRNLVHSCPLEVRQQRRSSGDTAQWSRGKIKEFEYALRKEGAPVRSPAARKQLAAGTELRIRAGDTTFVYLYCRLREGCTVHKLTGDTDYTFRIHAIAVRGAFGGVRVSVSSLDHSCPSSVRDARSRDGSAKAWTEQKIKEVEQYIAQGVSGVTTKLRKRWFSTEPSSSESGEEDDSECETSSDEAASTSTSTQKRFPSAQDVAKEVSKLVKAGPAAFPSANQSFSRARELLIHLYAFAQSRGFTVHRKSDVSDKQHLRLICAHGHHRYAGTRQGQCRVGIIADAGSDGLWRITSSELKHNHEIDEVDDDGQASPRASKREYTSSTSSSSERREDKRPVQHAAFLPSSTPTTSTPLHLEDLAALLYSIFPTVPAHELELVVIFLAHLGLSTLEDLATLVLLESSTLQHLVDAVQLPSLNPLEQASMRTAFKRCLETIRQQAKANL